MKVLKKKMNKKGFTLAELLIVVAIIAVLVAVSIPIFTAQLQKARVATNQANARAAYAGALAEQLTDDEADAKAHVYKYTTSDGKCEAYPGTDKAKKNALGTNISDWDTTTDDKALGTKVYNTWYVFVGADNQITGYLGE